MHIYADLTCVIGEDANNNVSLKGVLSACQVYAACIFAGPVLIIRLCWAGKGDRSLSALGNRSIRVSDMIRLRPDIDLSLSLYTYI